MKIKIGVAAGVIVGMLAWCGIIKYNEYSDKLAEDAEKIIEDCMKNQHNIETSIELYQMEKRSAFPGKFDALVSAGYFKEIPTCPAGGTYTLYKEDDEYTCKCTCSIEEHSIHRKYSFD